MSNRKAAPIGTAQPLSKGNICSILVVLTARFLHLSSTPVDDEQVSDEEVIAAATRVLQSQRRLEPDDVLQLITDYLAGQSVTQLARHWDIHRTTVMAHLKRHDVPTRPHRRKLTDQQVSEAARLYQAGTSLNTLGQHYFVDPQTVSRELKAINVTIRPPGRWG